MTVAIQRGPDLWTVDGVLDNPLLPLGLRMTIIRLSDGSLLLHSPIPLAKETIAELDALGKVRWIVAPNRAHHLYVGKYVDQYPEAKLYGAPELPQKRRDLRFDAVLSDTPPSAWALEIDQHLFRGMPFLNEVLFFHKPSRTLIATDLIFNLKREPNRALPMRLFLLASGAEGRFGPHRLVRFLIRDRAAAAESVERVMRWDFDRIIMSHGELVESGGREKFVAALAYLSAR